MTGFVSTAEAAKIIGCVDSRIRQLLRDKKLVGERVGRDWLVSKASAEAYRDAQQGRGWPRGQKRGIGAKKKPKKG